MNSRYIHLGFEVGSADPIVIPIRHMAVTGQTQESGKTTTLTALIARAGLPAIAFLTKRGEGEMPGRKILPFFQERADWQFVQSILESTMKERMKFERAWIVRACQGAKTLADVQRNIVKLEGTARNALSKDVYMLLGEYLDRVVPMIATLPKDEGGRAMEYYFGHQVHNGAVSGLSVMDLTVYPEELQMLVISSTLEWIHKHSERVITIIPEAWKFIPQGRNTPVKIIAEKLAREGAALRNYLWIDSQDMAAVDKMMLRACAVWLIGVQREANEIKRALSNMPAGLKKPKAEAVATLQLGQFFACYGNEIRKTYVQPAWMDEKAGKLIASGRLDVHSIVPPHTPTPKQPAQAGKGRVESPAGSPAMSGSPVREVPQSFAQEEEMQINPQTLEALKMAIKDGAKDTALHLLEGIAGNHSSGAGDHSSSAERAGAAKSSARGYSPQESLSNEQFYQAFKARLMHEAPGLIISLTKKVPEIEVTVQREKIAMNTQTLSGRMAVLISEGFFNERRGNSDVKNALAERGWPEAPPNISNAFKKLTQMGFLRDVGGCYQAVEGMKVNVVAA